MIRDPSDGSTKKPLNGYERLKAKHGENWGICQQGPEPDRLKFVVPSKEELELHYATHNIGFQFKAMSAGKINPKEGE